MADFTGMTVRLTTRNPPNSVVQGRVKEVIAGQRLTLQNAHFPQSGERVQMWMVMSANIADLQIVDTQANATTALPQQKPAQPTPAQQKPARQFVDPAILSYGRSPVQPTKSAEPSTPNKSMLAKAAESLPSQGSPFIGEAGLSTCTPPRKASQVKDGIGAPQTSRPGPTPAPEAGAEGAQETDQQEGAAKKKKARRSLKKKGTAQDPPPVMNTDVSRNGNDMNGSVRRGKGWRQTPLLQPSPQTSSPQRARKDRKDGEETQQNGWATEDATDIQDMGDFDFEANHRLFDKKHVFDQLRQDDSVGDGERLVSSNRIPPKPGTYGGKNLHPTENVLSPQLGPKYNSNELGSTSDADTELNFGNGRSSSRHSEKRSQKKQPSRQNSAQVERVHPLSASMSSERGMTRSVTSLNGKSGRSVPAIATSPHPDHVPPPISAVTSAPKTPAAPLPARVTEAYLAILPAMAPCPSLLTIEQLEDETVARYGLSHDAITENAARCIAETALRVSSTSRSRRGSRANTLRDPPESPTIVVLVGSHTSGARAVAAARHLASRGMNVILAEVELWDKAAQLDVHQFNPQVGILRRLAKTSAGKIKRGPWKRAQEWIKKLPAPPAVIIDALLAGFTYDLLPTTTSYNENVADEVRRIIDWANRSRAPVLSVRCPSGVSELDGQTTMVEGEPLAVRPERVLCLALPLPGLLEAMHQGERWEVSVADIGINIGVRADEAINFGGEWIVDTKFVDATQGDGTQ